MRVGLNATCFNERPSGAKQRFLGIYGALIQRRPDIEFVIYEPADCRVGRWFEGAANLSVRPTPFPSTRSIRKSLAGPFFWRKQLRRDRLDIFEHFYLPLVKAPDCPTILTVHDIRPVLQDVPQPKRALYGALVHSALAKAEHVVTVSDTMRAEILEFHPGAAVSRIYNGIDPAPFQRAEMDAEQTRRSLSLPAHFVLSVGHLEVRKNYIALLRAIADLRAGGRDISLVIVGNYGVQDNREREVRSEVERLGLGGHVRLLKEVSDGELADLYALCSLVAFPSIYEGFGIPILEAMAAHRPIVLSDIAVFRELTQGKGAYFPPQDGDALAATIERVLSSRAEQQRLISYGDARVGDFNFSTLAAQVAQLYERLR
ncbi:MAG: glycosyltransferase family 4 protein [Pseudomonadota bacterium]|nr:glycosyltransferase family 4 protein [Pseudomonadota bacterium]